MMKTDRLKEVLHPDQLYFPDVAKKDAFDFVMAVCLILFFFEWRLTTTSMFE